MPRSATGSWTEPGRRVPLFPVSRHRVSGFTLLEVMVVIFIMATLTSLVLLATGDSERGDRELRREADRLALAMDLASEDAMLRTLELGLVINREGYRFVMLESSEWRDYGSGNRALRAHRLPEGLDVVVESEGFNAELTEEDDGTNPQIIFLSSGEVTPFIIRLGRRNEPPLTVIEGDAAGNIRTRPADELTTAGR